MRGRSLHARDRAKRYEDSYRDHPCGGGGYQRDRAAACYPPGDCGAVQDYFRPHLCAQYEAAVQADREIHTAREDICFAENDAEQEQAYQRGNRDCGIGELVDAVRERHQSCGGLVAGYIEARRGAHEMRDGVDCGACDQRDPVAEVVSHAAEQECAEECFLDECDRDR